MITILCYRYFFGLSFQMKSASAAGLTNPETVEQPAKSNDVSVAPCPYYTLSLSSGPSTTVPTCRTQQIVESACYGPQYPTAYMKIFRERLALRVFLVEGL